MIYVTIAEEKCTGRLILQLKGHAGAAPVGEDPVCAAASILTYTAAQFFGCLYAEGKLQLEAVAGDIRDQAVVEYSPIPNPDYKLSRKKAGGGNWT